MVTFLATRFSKHIAYCLLLIFLGNLKAISATSHSIPFYPSSVLNSNQTKPFPNSFFSAYSDFHTTSSVKEKSYSSHFKQKEPAAAQIQNANFIGGPGQPEMSSFKSVGADNMVNLFTGDFSYNIPLMDVGGYPINIFYNGGITMEQEASWVGLGWNINPGSITRNMRGVPDDFDGSDVITQVQKVKPNITWGFNVGADFELTGFKALSPVTTFLGLTFNNYLGPALDFGIKGGVGLKIGSKVQAEKSADPNSGFKLNAGFNANASSRYGFSFSPSVSLTSMNFLNGKGLSSGVRLSTNYNSRSGINQFQISEQVAYNYQLAKSASDRLAGIANNSSAIGQSILSSTISFARPSYVPAIRMPITNESFSGHFQLGPGLFGGYTSVETEAYQQKAYVADSNVVLRKPMVGYLFLQNATSNPHAIMDFSRMNDNEVTPHTPIISAPQYTYDVFSIQGEGTGGTFRAYRNDHGFVRDNLTKSGDKSKSIGADVGFPGHYGGNFNTISTPTTIGSWINGNKLRNLQGFIASQGDTEAVYFRNPGENSVLSANQFDKIGGLDLVRFKLGGTDAAPTIENTLERFDRGGKALNLVNFSISESNLRKRRTQVISYLSALDASRVGLDTLIESYDATTALNAANNLNMVGIQRVGGYRKPHHISQISVTEADGKRYIYGVPVYNVRQKDFNFSVSNTEDPADRDKVLIQTNEHTPNSPLLNATNQVNRAAYLQVSETPAYAHSFLLSGLLSPDYVDVTGDGITEDDLGSGVKFNYTRSGNLHKWRTPLTTAAKGNFNPGNLTEVKDDKAIVSYGERESWYLHSIESKTMVAIFSLENRADGKGSMDSIQGVDASDNTSKRLKKIDLYNKSDLKKVGLANAKPVKSVFFAYSYTLCSNTPDNTGATELLNGVNVNVNKGKLTLDSIYFTYNGKVRINKNKYAFSYTSVDPNSGTVKGNPSYEFNASDRWGNYKPNTANPAGMRNTVYPYVIQRHNQSAVDSLNFNAGAWSLKKVLTPSGGQLEVHYESDDYSFVQNRRASVMMPIVSLSKGTGAQSSNLYTISNNTIVDNDRVYIRVPSSCNSRQEVYTKYLQGLEQIAVKLAVRMPKGIEYVPAYATVADYDVVATDQTLIWIKLNMVDGLNPFSVAAIEYLREQLPGQAYAPGYDVSESAGLQQVANMLIGMFASLGEILKDPAVKLRQKLLAQSIDVNRSFVRLNDPDGIKFGGGHRVKSIRFKDNWQAMTGQFTSEYGQEYDYTNVEDFNGGKRKVSSGVASYEPSVGGEENPFQSIVTVANKLPLGPTSFGAIEMPVLEGLFPAPVVGYSKVTVRSLQKADMQTGKKSRSGVGKQVTEFYTAKDFPVLYNHTSFDLASDKQAHRASTAAFLFKYAFDSRALSQGFIVETNDMHGKLKSQASFAENDTATRINYTENYYRNTGRNGLNDKFDFVYNNQGGKVIAGNMGIDVELMNDVREFSVKTSSLEVQGQADLFPIGIVPLWLPFIWPVSGNSENTYRAVTCTKLVSYHGVLDSVVVIDKGSQVATKNLLYDAETGDIIVSRTHNEFKKPVYTVNYPAYWAYSGMGLAYKNTDAIFSNVNILDGRIVSNNVSASLLESGDELYVLNAGSVPVACGSIPVSSDKIRKVWVYNLDKNTSSLTDNSPSYVLLDDAGKVYTRSGVKFRVLRSGRRNMLSASVASLTCMFNPVLDNGTFRALSVDSTDDVITASALEFKEKWQSDADAFKRYVASFNPATCTTTETLDCNGYLEKSINPYLKGLLGTFRSHRSMVFYSNRKESDPLIATNLPQNGSLASYTNYWSFDGSNNLVPDSLNPKWVWNNQVTRFNARGLELETRNALDVYTGALYGFNKTVPVAVANNSRYNEMMYDGFEGYRFNESINGAVQNSCDVQHLNWSSVLNSVVYNADSAGTLAHTGRYVLRLNPNSTASQQLTVEGSSVSNGYTLLFKSDTAKVLSDLGGSHTVTPADGNEVYYDSSSGDFSGNAKAIIKVYPSSNLQGHRIATTWKAYMEVPSSGTYNFSLLLNSAYANMTSSNMVSYDNSLGVEIKSLSGMTINNTSTSYNLSSILGGGGQTKSLGYSLTLCKGIYEISGSSTEYYQATTPSDGVNTYQWNCSNCTFPVYKTLATASGCVSTSPIAAATEMIHPGLSLQSGKRMLFSAWVKDNKNAIANGAKATSQVNVNFDYSSTQNVTLYPEGPIIEGWQRYEGSFITPAASTPMSINLVNNTGGAIEFDDIRVHPYNSNMKSYAYDPVNLRLTAEMDENNYATFYEYDEEGGLVRTKVETKEGVKTVKETRSFQQKTIKQVL